MSILQLPNELLLQIASTMEESHIFALLRVNRRLSNLLLPCLYSYNIQYNRGSALPQCAENGLEEQVRYMLALNADVNSVDDEDRSALSQAAGHGHLALTQLMLDLKADPDQLSIDQRSPLSYAAEHGHLQLVQLLIDHGTNVDQMDMDGMSILHYAAFEGHQDIVKLLIFHGADADVMGHDYLDHTTGTPLSEAARGGQEAIARILLDLGADVNAGDDTGMSPLHYAARAGQGGPLKESHMCTPGTVPTAASPGPGAYTDDPGDSMTPSRCGKPRDYLATVKLLIARGANVQLLVDDLYGNTHGTALYSAAWSGAGDIVRLLIDARADVNTERPPAGKSPLWAAAYRGHETLLDMLLYSGARIRYEPHHARPLHAAAENGHVGVIEKLLANGVNVNATNTCNQTPLELAIQKKRTTAAQLLIAHGGVKSGDNK
ncbi:ankyrin [Penicillium hispanicum]|uniref:ankyrin n=1 Tax=Penicillium hispanicum TaxID=1080232 RepID=UPI0025420402|nr:ankyrin [Penicillium hispanicum]KAJ5595162.1 ankyrin [Penicillium hispanicum]